MNNKRTNIIILLFILLGVGIFFYPEISEAWNKRYQSEVIIGYDESILKKDKEEKNKYFEEAKKYNNDLFALKFPLKEYGKLKGYSEILNVMGNGVIGYVEIVKIDVKIPIYHGTSKATLNDGVGHLEGTSFPIGEKNSHTVLSGHRGLTGSKLFTDLDKMKLGDRFIISVIDKKLEYEVKNIETILPNNTSSLGIIKDEEWCTLLTCTPYGKNTHRLLIHGKRVKNRFNEEKPKDTRLVKKVKSNSFIVNKKLLYIIISLFIFILLILSMLGMKKKKSRKDRIRKMKNRRKRR